LITPRCRQ